ncbi:MAG: glycosyltransferase [Lachnospiraceae bacterium]|nr:glycosyltransferase [Lachnospiraceae bacterium]
MADVSVIIPVYNCEKYIEKGLRSVIAQSFSDLEILVINDGSTDGSGEILSRLAAEDERILLITQDNGGVASARNRGLEMATGTWLTFLDGDDYIDEKYIEHLREAAIEKNAAMVICGLTYVDEKGKTLSQTIPGEYRRYEKEEWVFRISAVCSHFYERSLWEKYAVHFQPGERGEDMPVSLFFGAVCDRITTIPETGYYYVQHPSSAIHNFKGLRNYNLPYVALEDAIRQVRKEGIANSPDFHELFVLRILSTCLFQLAPGTSREKMRELCDYILRILKTYYPKYYKNKKARLTARTDIPFSQKAAVKVLILLTRTGLIYPVSCLMSSRQKQAAGDER